MVTSTHPLAVAGKSSPAARRAEEAQNIINWDHRISLRSASPEPGRMRKPIHTATQERFLALLKGDRKAAGLTQAQVAGD